MKLKVLDREYETTKETLLDALTEIKEEQNSSLAFRKGCRSGVCGSCSVRVNGKEELACICKVQEGDEVESLKYHEVIKDLVVDLEKPLKKLQGAKAWLERRAGSDTKIEEEELIKVQSDCILCHSCYSACPVMEVNSDFLGPFALTRDLRYLASAQEEDKKSKVDSIQQNGIWDCTLCGECVVVCPMGINPKNDILNLRSRSAAFGYTDPSASTMGFGFDGMNSF